MCDEKSADKDFSIFLSRVIYIINDFDRNIVRQVWIIFKSIYVRIETIYRSLE